jgi:hypothetical protein
MTDVQPGADILGQQDIPGDNALLGNGRPSRQAEPRGQRTLIHLGINSQSGVLGVLRNHSVECLGLFESPAHDQRVVDAFAIVRKDPNGTTARGHGCHRGELLPRKAFGDCANWAHRDITGLAPHLRNGVGDAGSISDRVCVGHRMDGCEPTKRCGL